HRGEAICAHDEAATDADRRARSVRAVDAVDTPGGVAVDPTHPHAGHEPHARRHGGVDEDAVEDVTARCHEVGDAGALGDLAAIRTVLGGERDRGERRGSTSDDLVEQSPAGELYDAAAGDRVGRHRVVGSEVAVDEHDVVALPG